MSDSLICLLTGFVADVTWSVDGDLDCFQVSGYLRRIRVDDDRHVKALTCSTENIYATCNTVG